MIPQRRYSFACKDCPDRAIGCHSSCERYIKQAEQLRKENERIYQEKQCDQAQVDRKLEARFRMLKKRGRKSM